MYIPPKRNMKAHGWGDRVHMKNVKRNTTGEGRTGRAGRGVRRRRRNRRKGRRTHNSQENVKKA